MSTRDLMLVINGGSSSIKCAVYQTGPPLQRLFFASIDRVGLPGCTLTYTDHSGKAGEPILLPADAFPQTGDFLIQWLRTQIFPHQLIGIGHRVVHGLGHHRALPIDTSLLQELRGIYAYDPEHLPIEVGLIGQFQDHFPGVRQVASFDTSFHADLPRVATLLPIPRRFYALGVRRYGFHGLSYTYLMEQLIHLSGPGIARGRVILAHLGGGSSMVAVRDGRSIDTSMGFTPTGGLPMGTRSGDLDPGVAWYILQNEQLTATQFNHLVNHESGLLGISGASADMRDLLDKESTDPAAADAISHYCYQVKKNIGAYTAALGGLDALVFSGGIGEHAAPIRSRVCAGLEYLGLQLDERLNARQASEISAAGSSVRVFVIPTDEEQIIARNTAQLLNL